MIRWFISIAVGTCVSIGLFWLMQVLISNNQQGEGGVEDLQMVEFVRLKRESEARVRERKMPDPPPDEKQPPPLLQMEAQPAQSVHSVLPALDMPNLDIPLSSDRFTGGSAISGMQMGRGKISTNVIPLVRIPPRYPLRAARRRIEGWVKLEFTITETGTVKDAVIVESYPSDIFDEAALNAIAKWEFKAKIIDGEAFEQRAIQVLQFKLSK